MVSSVYSDVGDEHEGLREFTKDRPKYKVLVFTHSLSLRGHAVLLTLFYFTVMHET